MQLAEMSTNMQIGIGVCVSIGLIVFIMGLAWINSRPKGHERRPSIPNIPRPTPMPPPTGYTNKATLKNIDEAEAALKRMKQPQLTPMPSYLTTPGATPCAPTAAYQGPSLLADWREVAFNEWLRRHTGHLGAVELLDPELGRQIVSMRMAFLAGVNEGLKGSPPVAVIGKVTREDYEHASE